MTELTTAFLLLTVVLYALTVIAYSKAYRKSLKQINELQRDLMNEQLSNDRLRRKVGRENE
ncbi:hypothetical protein SAMN05216389_1265 [Oceanobacillus limi]|uniref:Uncharacterized protein n=1 Tax=Oceanobacillus limi TaxID=930131 RepID=A0A1I0H0V9_9BACI|nr:hypothetical protein [Oceanobacillus limi]SET76426.1 hypothetical protein SAMN05216389_1265 [Oceanobacillus limi]